MKFLGFLVCLVVVAAAVAGTKDFQCPSVRHVLLPSERQCDKFYRCYKGSLSSEFCPYGTSFDLKYAKCRPNRWVDCGDRKLSRGKCLSAVGRFPVEGQCHLYTSCSGGAGKIYTCAPGTVFSRKVSKCVLPSALPKDHSCSPENLFQFRCQNPVSAFEDAVAREEGEERLGLNGIAGFGLGALFSPLVFKKKAILARPYFAQQPLMFAPARPMYQMPPVQIQSSVQIPPPMPVTAPTPPIMAVPRPQRIDLIIERPRPIINQVMVTRTQAMVVTRTVDRPHYVDVMMENKRPVLGQVMMNVPTPIINTVFVDKPQRVDVTMESVRPVVSTVLVERPVRVERPVMVDRVENVNVVLNQGSAPASVMVPSGAMQQGMMSIGSMPSGMSQAMESGSMSAQAFAQATAGGAPMMQTGDMSQMSQMSAGPMSYPSSSGAAMMQGGDMSAGQMSYSPSAGSAQYSYSQSPQYSQSYSLDSMPTVSNCRVDCGPGIRSATSLVVGKQEQDEARSDESVLDKFATEESDELFLEKDEDRQAFGQAGCRLTCYTVISRGGQTTRICRRRCRPMSPMYEYTGDENEKEPAVGENEDGDKLQEKLDVSIIDDNTGKKLNDLGTIKAIIEFLAKMKSPKEKVATKLKEAGVKDDAKIDYESDNIRIPISIVHGTIKGEMLDDNIIFKSFALKSDPSKTITIPNSQANQLKEMAMKMDLSKGAFELPAVILTSSDQLGLDEASVIAADNVETAVKIAEDTTNGEKIDLSLPIGLIAKAAESAQPQDRSEDSAGIDARSYPMPRFNKPGYNPCRFHLLCLGGRPMLQACPRGLAYSPRLTRCVRKEEVETC